MIEQDRVLAAPVVRFEQTARQVAPVEVLHGRIDRSRRDAASGPYDHGIHALGVIEVHDPHVRDRVRVEPVLVRARVARSGGWNASRTHHLDVRLAQARNSDQAAEQRGDLTAVEWHGQAQTFTTAQEAIEMVIEPEEGAVPHADDVIRDVRSSETRVEDRNARVLDRDDVADDVPGPLLELAGLIHRRAHRSKKLTPQRDCTSGAFARSPEYVRARGRGMTPSDSSLPRSQQVAEPGVRVLGSTALGLVIDMDEPEPLGVARSPLEVVHQRPREVPAYVDPGVDRVGDGSQVRIVVVDALLVVYATVDGDLVVVRTAALRDVQRREA